MPTRDTTIIGAVHALTSYRDHRDALRLLERIAVQVQPVMRARRWHVPSLQEFFPPNPNLLGINVNAGKLIRIRLRPSHAPDAFLPYEDLLGTMLHEYVRSFVRSLARSLSPFLVAVFVMQCGGGWG